MRERERGMTGRRGWLGCSVRRDADNGACGYAVACRPTHLGAGRALASRVVAGTCAPQAVAPEHQRAEAAAPTRYGTPPSEDQTARWAGMTPRRRKTPHRCPRAAGRHQARGRWEPHRLRCGRATPGPAGQPSRWDPCPSSRRHHGPGIRGKGAHRWPPAAQRRRLGAPTKLRRVAQPHFGTAREVGAGFAQRQHPGQGARW